MPDRRPDAGHALTTLHDFARRHPDLLLCGSITLLAAIVRLWGLGAIPAGIHGDEAQVGLDARRVIHSGWIGIYTWSALGQPAGHAYLAAPSIAIFGSNAWALRLPFTLIGIAAVPLAYTLVRMHTSRVEASFAAFFLAVSLWHLHFSRVAHWPISYGTVALGVLILWTLAIRTRKRRWFIAAGALLGLGLYTYNVYPAFVGAFTIWVAAYTFIYMPRQRAWAHQVMLAVGVSFLVGLPLFVFIATHTHDYFSHYDEYYRHYSVLRSWRFEQGDIVTKLDVLLSQVVRYADAYIWRGVQDNVDGSGADHRAIIDPFSLVLFFVGLGVAVKRWRQPFNLLCLCLFAAISLAGVLQTNATYRGTLGLAPFVCFLAAVPLAMGWREAKRLGGNGGWLLRSALGVLLLVITLVNLQAYFGRWAGSANFDKVYAHDFTDAIQYTGSLPGRPYVYFLGDRFSFQHETRLFLEPHMRGEDRSIEFGGDRGLLVDSTYDSVFLLVGGYAQDDTLALLRNYYPDGESYTRLRKGHIAFVVYTLPQPRLTPP